jgi:uncharacterized protein YndB with AHSA1/START domain
MEQKTKIHAEDGRQELRIMREFDLPLDLLFTAFVEPEVIEQWMGTKVLKFDGRPLGSYHFETTDPKGNKFGFKGAIHELIRDRKIVRTFEMEPASFGVQLEIYEFEALGENNSKLNMHVIYESAELRNEVLKLPFAFGINMAHNRIQEIMMKRK